MRRRWASQSDKRNAALSHALDSSPPRSAELASQSHTASSPAPQAQQQAGSSNDFLDHSEQRGDSPQSSHAQTSIDLSWDDSVPTSCSLTQPSIAQVFARQRALHLKPKPPPGPSKRYGPLPTVADLAVGPALHKPSPLALVKYPAPPPTALALAAPPPIKRSRTGPALQCGGLQPPPPPPQCLRVGSPTQDPGKPHQIACRTAPALAVSTSSSGSTQAPQSQGLLSEKIPSSAYANLRHHLAATDI